MSLDPATLAPSFEALLGSVPSSLEITKLEGDASTRTYYRVRSGASTWIVMQLPADAFRSDEGTGSAPRPTELPFVAVQRLLAARGVRVPAIHAIDLERGVLLLEDLGDETFARRLERTPEEKEALYERAVDLVAAMHDACARPEPGHLVYERSFDEALLRWELDHFREWGLEAVHGPLPPPERARLDEAFDALARTVAAMPAGFVHRDVQSRNLMLRGGELVLIDFQDAFVGPYVYDLVALLCDSYVSLDAGLQERLIRRYAEARGLSPEGTEACFWRVAAQRKLKDSGRFVFIDRVRKNPSFLRHVPQSLVYVGRALDRVPELTGVRELLAAKIPGFPGNVPVPGSGAE